MDALLLEEPALPLEIWIAERADGVFGSGTPNDPYDGGVAKGPEISGTPSYDPTEVIAYAVGHGYKTGDIVYISGITGPGANEFNRAFTVIKINEWEFKFTLARPAAGPSAALDTPSRWSSRDSIYDTLLSPDMLGWAVDVDSSKDDPISDLLLSSEPVNWAIGSAVPSSGVLPNFLLCWPVAAVDTGPVAHGFANFEAVTIEGAADPAFNGTFPIVGKEAMKFRYRPENEPTGISSPSCTCSRVIHRFDEVMKDAGANAIIRLGPGTFKTRGHCPAYSYSYGNYFVGFAMKTGQKLIGSGIGATVLKLVYAVESLGNTGAVDSFVVLNHCEVADLTIDCNLGGQLVPAKMDFAPVVCRAANFWGSFNRMQRIRAINWGTQANAECFVLFMMSHYSEPDSGVHNVISDCIVEKPSENNFHESSTIGNVGFDAVKANARSPVVRNCFVNCGYANGVSSEPVKIESIRIDDVDGFIMTDTFLDSGSLSWLCLDLQFESLDAGQVAFGTLMTKKPHNRAEGNNVHIFGVGPAGHVLNGTFKVVQKISDTQLMFKFTGPPIPFLLYDASGAIVGVDFHGPGASSGTGCVTEGNSVYDCLNPFYADTGSSRSLLVRNNYYSNFAAGVNIYFPPGQGEGFRDADDDATAPPPLTHIGDLAIFRAKAPHRFLPGQAVVIAGARITIGGDTIISSIYNGTFSVDSINPTDNRIFSYRMSRPPEGDTDADRPTPGKALQFRALWQIRQFIIENNIYDVYRTENDSAYNPQGIGAGGYYPSVPPYTPYTYPQMVIRENLMRRVDGAISVAVQGQYLPVGVRVYSVEKGIIQENIIDLDDPNPIRHLHSKSVKSFNNMTASGKLVRGHDETPPENLTQKDDELATLIEDAMVLAL